MKCRRGDNDACGEDINEIGPESHDAAIECIRRSTSPRDVIIPQRGDRRLYPFVDDRNQRETYTNAGYTCISDGVACGILEKMPDIGTHFCHPKWNSVEKAVLVAILQCKSEMVGQTSSMISPEGFAASHREIIWQQAHWAFATSYNLML